MKLLLTSNGITNKTIANSFHKLLGKPFAESKLVFIPTAANISPNDKTWLIRDLNNCAKLGFREIHILNIDATPQERIWRPILENADAILLGGGNTFYLMHWLKKSGLAKALPTLLKKKIYVGISAGSIVAAPDLSLSSKWSRDSFEEYRGKKTKNLQLTKSLGLVDFHVRPHFKSPGFPESQANFLKKIAKNTKGLIYGLDNDSALEITDGKARIVSEGETMIFSC